MIWMLYIAGVLRVEFEGAAAAAACHRVAAMAEMAGAKAACVLSLAI